VGEWLMQQANKLGIRGGAAFKAMAGLNDGTQKDGRAFPAVRITALIT